MQRRARNKRKKLSLPSIPKEKSDLRESTLKKIHKIYLVIALLFGVAFSIGMPLFSEPDGQWHYIVESSMVGLSNDMSVYGEQNTSGSYVAAIQNYRNGTYFQNYYETKVRLIPISQQYLRGTNNLPSKTSFYYLARVIPAIGIWIGYHIYPSMGVMVTFGRLLNMLVLTLLTYWIIKRVRKGKLLFTIIALSPVFLGTISSLSHDAPSLVLGALMISEVINIIDRKVITRNSILRLLIFSIFVRFVAKTNIDLLILLVPLVFIFIPFFKRNRKSVWEIIPKGVKIIAGFVVVLLGIIVVFHVTRQYGGPLSVLGRFWMNATFNFQTTPSLVVSNLNNVLTQPFIGQNMMPYWLTTAWFVMLFAGGLSEKKYIEDKGISLGGFVLFVLSIVAVYYGIYNWNNGTMNSNVVQGLIIGPQGRYFTPTLFLFALIFGYKKSKLKLNLSTGVLAAFLVLVVVTNFLLIFDSYFNIFYIA